MKSIDEKLDADLDRENGEADQIDDPPERIKVLKQRWIDVESK